MTPRLTDSPMRPPRAVRSEPNPERRNWACLNGHETYEWASGGQCPVCGAPLEESLAPSFKQKVRSRVPEPSQRLMDEVLEDEK